MNKVIMIKKYLSIVLLALLFSCGNKNVEPIVYQVPENLAANSEVQDFLSEYAMVGGRLISYSSELSSGASVAKMAKASFNMSKVASDIEELNLQAKEIENSLDESQKKAFNAVIYRIESSIGQMRLDIDAMDESEIAANEALKSKVQTEIDKETAMREEAIAQMKADGTWEEPNVSSNELDMPKFMHILFPLIVIAGFILAGIFSIKKVKNRFKEISYTVSDVKGKYSDAKEKVKDLEAEGKVLDPEQKKAFEFLDKHLS